MIICKVLIKYGFGGVDATVLEEFIVMYLIKVNLFHALLCIERNVKFIESLKGAQNVIDNA